MARKMPLDPILPKPQHRHASSKQTFAKMDNEIHQALWRWAKRRHPRKGKKWVRNRYFKTFRGNRWTFTGEEREGNIKSHLSLCSLCDLRASVVREMNKSITNFTNFGICIQTAVADITDNTVNNNSIGVNNGNYGGIQLIGDDIEGYQVTHNCIIDNEIKNNTSYGLHLSKNAHQNLIMGNKFEATGDIQIIILTANSDENLIMNNDFNDCLLTISVDSNINYIYHNNFEELRCT